MLGILATLKRLIHSEIKINVVKLHFYNQTILRLRLSGELDAYKSE